MIKKLLSFLSICLLAVSLKAATATVTEGAVTTVTISLASVSGTAPFTYQWRKSTPSNPTPTAIAGATSATLVITNPKVADSGTYSVVVSNSAGSTVSDDAVVTVNPAPPTLGPTKITTQ